MPYAAENSQENTTDKSTAAKNVHTKPNQYKTAKQNYATGTKTKTENTKQDPEQYAYHNTETPMTPENNKSSRMKNND